MKTHSLIACGLFSALGFCTHVAGTVVFDHHTFEDFSKGSVSDSGANLYISRAGRIQYINLWDLNADGFPEVIVNNDHNHYETPDALVYHNRAPYGLRSLFGPMQPDAPAYQNLMWTLDSLSSITRLPTEGGGKALLADLTGSGYPDLLFANFVHGSTLNNLPVYIYWGGPGGYTAARRSLLPVDRGTGIAVGDLNGDGLNDIVVSNAGRENLASQTGDLPKAALESLAGDEEKRSYIFYQTEGGFTEKTREIVPTLFALDVKIADLDKSGRKALIFLEAGTPGGLRIIGRRDSGWSAPVTLPVIAAPWGSPSPPGVRQLLVQDLNQDGYPDIFVPSEGGASEIFWNNHGQFSHDNRTVLTTENALGAAAADLNQDGFVDLVVANYTSTNSKGVPVYATNSFIWWGSAKGFSSDHRTPLPTLGATSVCLADVNGTGRLDILFSQHRSESSFGAPSSIYTFDVPSYIYLNSAAGFSPMNRVDLQGFGGVSILAGDLQKTGKTDVILINRQSGREDHPEGDQAAEGLGVDDPGGVPMYIYRGNAGGNYGPANIVRVPESRYQTFIAFADVEDAGKAALAYLPKDGRSVLVRYDIYNYPNSREFTEIKLPFEGKTVNVADFNRDGYLDFLVLPGGPVYNQGGNHNASSQGALIFGQGKRNFRVQLFDFKQQGLHCAVGDIDNDGVLDAVTCGFGEICIFRGNNSGSFHFEAPIVLANEMQTSTISLADFGNRGWLDILCQNYGDKTTKDNAVESWVLVNDHGKFSLDRKRTFHTYGALAGTVAQIWGDGKPAFINANYLDGTSRRAATLLLHSDKEGYPVDEGKVRLASYSSSANYAMDFTGSGYLDVLVFNHSGQIEYNGELEPKGGMHGFGSLLYRGAKDGYSNERVTPISSFGPHFRTTAEPGSISRRDPFETYTSSMISNPAGAGHFVLTVSGRFNQRQSVEPEILVENAEGKRTVATLHPEGQSASEIRFGVDIPAGAKFLYRLKLKSSNSGGGPVVSGVRLETSRESR